jgi:hypothetical protein
MTSRATIVATLTTVVTPKSMTVALIPSFVWKTRRQGRIKPVIARDTTYSVSLLTCTTGGSNFAIPSTEIPPHGNGAGLEESSQQYRRGPAPSQR